MAAVLRHGQFILGPEVRELEMKLGEFVGVRNTIAVASGTDAILVALMALGVESGDEIITTPFSFIAAAEAIALMGAIPAFVDIDEKTYNLNPFLLESAITSRTKGILPVSLFGQCADFDEINAVAANHRIPVIEDACQSFGAMYKGRRSCSLSRVACTSFFPSKPLGCYGDGGACFTDDDSLADRMRRIRAHGQGRRYHHEILGLNSRLDTLQAAVLLAKMTVFDEELAARSRIAKRYEELLQDTVATPCVAWYNSSVYALYSVQVNCRDTVREILRIEGIPTAVHYPVPLHLQPVFSSLGIPEGSLPVAESLAKRVLSLPMHPYLSEDQLTRIASALRAACR